MEDDVAKRLYGPQGHLIRGFNLYKAAELLEVSGELEMAEEIYAKVVEECKAARDLGGPNIALVPGEFPIEVTMQKIIEKLPLKKGRR